MKHTYNELMDINDKINDICDAMDSLKPEMVEGIIDILSDNEGRVEVKGDIVVNGNVSVNAIALSENNAIVMETESGSVGIYDVRTMYVCDIFDWLCNKCF